VNDLMLNIDNIVTESASKFVSTLSQYKWDLLPDSQLQAAKQALTKNDYIMNVACGNTEAVHDALIKSAILGLDLTEGKRQGWLLPRKNQFGKVVIQLQVGYKGVEAIHQRMGVIDRLSIRTVFEDDVFEWSGDDREKPRHEADWFSNNRGDPKGAFAITYYPDGTYGVTVASIDEIYTKHRDRSDSWKSYQKKMKEDGKAYPPPWVSDEKAMIEKTMAYIASKQWPANIRDSEMSSKILETLHEVNTADYSLGYTQEQKEVFNTLLEAKDALGMRLFELHVGIEVNSALWGDLIRAIPRGGKGKKREEIDSWRNAGPEILANVEAAINDEDIGLLHESVEGICDVTKVMLVKYLGEGSGATLVSMMGGAAA